MKKVYAVVVKDILRKEIFVLGNLPEVIEKGYKTWFYDNQKRFFGTEGTMLPEGNRWLANIPGIYFKEITKEEYYSVEKEFNSVNNYYLI